MKYGFVCFAGILAIAMSVNAASTTYTGSDGVWSTPASWSNGLPVAGDTATITYGLSLSGFGGQSVGAIESPGKILNLEDTATLTMNNNGAMATINAAIVILGDGTNVPTLAFTDNLTITLASSKQLSLQGTIQGNGTLTLTGTASSVKSFTGSTFDVDRLDISNFGAILSYNGGGASLSDVTIYTGSQGYFALGTNGNSFSGLSGSSIEMDNAYALVVGNTGETVVIDTWKVGSTYMAPGTYNASSGIVDGVDMAVIFGSTNLNLTVSQVPEPATMSLLCIGAAGVLLRRRRR